MQCSVVCINITYYYMTQRSVILCYMIYDDINIFRLGRLNRVKASMVFGGCTCGGDCYFDGYLDSVCSFGDSALVVVYVQYLCVIYFNIRDNMLGYSKSIRNSPPNIGVYL